MIHITQKTQHAKHVRKTVTHDGDFDAVVISLDTGKSSIASGDRYKHTIYHNLGREPVGAQIILSDGETNMYVVQKDATKIIVKFTAANINVNVRIW